MGSNKNTWIGATAVGALVILVASWFLLISPKLGEASDVRAQVDQTNQSNELLSLKVAQLAAQSAKLPEMKEELAALRVEIPTSAQISEFLRQVDTIAASASVVVTATSPGTPELMVPEQAAPSAPQEGALNPDGTPAEPTAEPTAEPSETPSAEPSSSAAPGDVAAALIPPGMVDVPVSLSVIGTYTNTVAFLDALQQQIPRLYLVTGITATGQKETAAAGGKPDLELGDQELVITGYLYVLPDTVAAVEPEQPGELPGATDRNPLIPVAGE